MSADQPTGLAHFDAVSRALTEAETIDEIKLIRDKAEAVRCFARSAALGLQSQNGAAKVKLEAERKAGKMLRDLHLRGGLRKANGQRDRPSLADLGVSPVEEEVEFKRGEKKGVERLLRECEVLLGRLAHMLADSARYLR